MNPIFKQTDEPFLLVEIAQEIKVDYDAVRGVLRRLKSKPETAGKVAPLGTSRTAEYSAEAANFIARRCLTKSRPSRAAQ